MGEQTEARTSFTVPAQEAAYRLVVDGERGAPATLSTRVSGVWTYRSGHVAGGTPARLPVYDDGATWTRAEVHGPAAVLRHPAGDGYVSLRARAVDGSGNTAEQTIIRAYRIRPS
ncbi:hypothetical protein [Nonomuraea wenchangensis]|uniref:hypothetical protein n=1 Tax=Nonomuraea wenchangensis TaxID=568860 RepID=UPI0033276806